MEAIKTTKGTRTNSATSMTDLRSVIRLNSNNLDAQSFSFVLDEVLQLIETPVANPIVHSFSSSDFPYSSEVFHNDFVSIKFGNNLFTYVVIYPLHPTVFSSTKLLKKSFSRSSAFSLKFGTQISKFPFNIFNIRGIEETVIRSDSKIIYSKVNTKNFFLQRAFSIDFSRKTKQEEASAFFIGSQQTFSNIPFIEVLFITIRDCERNFNSSFDCSNAQNIVLKGSAARKIVSHRTIINNWLGFSSLDHPTSLFYTGNGELCLKSSLTQELVDKWMQSDIVFDFALPGLINTELQGFRIDFDSSDNFRSRNNFDFGCSFYTHKHIKTLKYINILEDKGSNSSTDQSLWEFPCFKSDLLY